MEKFKTPEIPENQIEFAKAVAEVAKKHGVTRFTLIYEPDWKEPLRDLYGTLKIIFSSKDGRGRPANNLSIVYKTTLEHTISSTSESCS